MSKTIPLITLGSCLVTQLTSGAILAHRFSFDDSDPLADSVGGNNGVLQNGATTGGGSLILAGLGTSRGANHMAFSSPVAIGSNFGATGVTIESWYTDSNTGT
jgi:hypothetical protein